MQRPPREVAFALALSALLVVSMVAPVAAVDGGAVASLETDTSDQSGANVTVSTFLAPTPAAPNVTIGIGANVTNVGTVAANQTVEYRFENETLWSTGVHLEPGESTDFYPDINLPDADRGNYTHGIYTAQDEQTSLIELRTDSAALETYVLDERADDPGEIIQKIRFDQPVDTDHLVSGAEVSVAGTDLQRETDANGIAVFENVSAPENHTLSVSHELYENTNTTLDVEVGTRAQQAFLLTPEPGAVTVEIRNSSGAALGGADVTLSENGSVATANETGADGTYSFEDVAPGNYTVVANATDHHVNRTDLTVEANETKTVDFTLQPLPGSVEGTVTDTRTGDQIQDVTVTIGNSSRPTLNQTEATNGNFSFEGLAVGPYSINATHPNYGANESSVDVAPNTTNTTSLALRPKPGTLTGTVQDNSTGASIEGASIVLEDEDGDAVNTTKTDAGGNYSIADLPLANYTAVAAHKNYENESMDFDIGPGSESFSPNLTPLPGSIEVDVANDTGAPIPNATVVIDGVGENTTGTDGTALFGDVHPGNYSVTAEANGFVENATNVTVAPNEPENTTIVLFPEPGSIEGQVTSKANLDRFPNAGPVVNATVSLMRGDEEMSKTRTDSDGEYAFESVTPDEYSLAVSAKGYQDLFLPVSVNSNEENTTNLELAPSEISVVVSDFDAAESAEPGDTLDPSANVTNPGNLTVRETVHYTFDGESQISQPVQLGPGETKPVVFDDYRIPENTDTKTHTHGVNTSESGDTGEIEIRSFLVDFDGVVNDNKSETVMVDGADIVFSNRSVTFPSVESGPSGLFSTRVIGSKDYTVTVTHPDYETLETSISVGNSPEEKFFRLNPKAGKFAGTVTDNETSQPVENATISVADGSGDPVRTDASGAYELTNVSAWETRDILIAGADYHENESQLGATTPNGTKTINATLDRVQTYAGVDRLDAPDSVDQGATVDVTANVTNYGTTALENETVELVADGSTVANATVDLNETGATETVAFTYDAGGSGSTTLAIQTRNDTASRTLTVEDESDDDGAGGGFAPPSPPSSSPSDSDDDDGEPDLSVLSADAAETSIVPGGTVRVDVTVQNRGDGEGSIDLELTADGETVDSETVTVPAGSNVGTTLSGSLEEPGSYELTVEGESAGTLEVEGSSDGDGIDAEFDDEEVVGGSSDDGQPGFGVLAAVAALVLGVGYAVGRSRTDRR